MALDSRRFVEALLDHGYGIGSGVPCSWLDGLTNALLNEPRFHYITAAQEGEAVAIASGADLAGKKALAAMQGSGLTNAGSPLTSYNYTFQRGVLLFVSLRGDPAFAKASTFAQATADTSAGKSQGSPDEPQHELMGRIAAEQLTLWKIEHDVLSGDMKNAVQQVDQAEWVIAKGKSFSFIVRKDTFAPVPLETFESRPTRKTRVAVLGRKGEALVRRDILQALLPWRDKGAVILATTGHTGRELFSLGDHDAQLYMVGSMGCVSSLGLGAAHAAPSKKFIAIDGDGALLMRLGSLATNAWGAPANLLHIVLDNGRHESTGAQRTASHMVNFPALAAAAGYPRVVVAQSLAGFQEAVEAWHKKPILTFLYVRTKLGAPENLPRPNVTPAEKARRLRKFLTSQ